MDFTPSLYADSFPNLGQIKRLQSKSEPDFAIIWVPRRTLVSDKILEEAGVLGDVSVEELDLQFVPLEQDVLSLELEESFGDLCLVCLVAALTPGFADSFCLQRKDPTSVFLAAQALMGLQKKHGLFPRIIGKGDNAHRLMELLLRIRTEASASEHSNRSRLGMMPSASVESLIIIDREIDLATPLLTQLTYEGLVDEKFGIQNNQIEIDTSIVGPAPGAPNPGRTPAALSQQGLKRKIQLDSSDKLYAQLRDANFTIVPDLLRKVARQIKNDVESRHEAKTTTELREFVNKLPGYQSEQQGLKIHTSLAEEISKYTQTDIFDRTLEVQHNLVAGSDPALQHDTIEELISRDIPLPVILRLLCLESCVSGGIRPKDLENFKRQILHAHGFQHHLTLDALEKMQLLQPRTSANALLIPVGGGSASDGSKTNYSSLRKVLRLIVDEVSEQDPNDIAYVYSGYAPLSVRLVQCVLQKEYLFSLTRGATAAPPKGVGGATHGWSGFEDALKSVKGETFNQVQKGEEQTVKARHMLTGTGGIKTVVIMYLGGITFTEIAALRFVAKREEGKRKFLICTTGIISGNSMMDAATEKRDFGKA